MLRWNTFTLSKICGSSLIVSFIPDRHVKLRKVLDHILYSTTVGSNILHVISCFLHPFIVQVIVTIYTCKNNFSMGCPAVRGDNPRALASGLSFIQVDKHGVTIIYHQHQ